MPSNYEMALVLCPPNLLPVLKDANYQNKVLVRQAIKWLDRNGFSTLADDLTEEASL